MSERVTDDLARRRVLEARVGRLGTVSAAGGPHLVPCCFALDPSADVVYSAVDDVKAKSSLALARLDHVRANPAVCLLVDHYTEDWSALWWVRLDGTARVIENADDPERTGAVDLLTAKYDQYRRRPPPGPVIAVDPKRWRSWSATT